MLAFVVMKSFRGPSAALTFLHLLSIFFSIHISKASLPGLHTRASPLEPLQLPDHHLDVPLAQTVPKLKDASSSACQSDSNPAHKRLGEKILRCFGRVDHPAGMQEVGGTVVPKQIPTMKMRKHLVIEDSIPSASEDQLEAHKLDELYQWKSIPEVTYFLGT
jgi:hypothetical protein